MVGRPGGSAESAVFSILQYIRQSPSLVGLPMCYLPTVLHNRNLSCVRTLHTLFELILTNIKDFGLLYALCEQLAKLLDFYRIFVTNLVTRSL